MSNPSNAQRSAGAHRPGGRSPRVWSGTAVAIAVIAGSVVAAAAGLASAQASHPAVATARNARLHETILVDSHGFTLYELSPETTRHLLCTSSACLHFWPPLKASSAKAKLTKGAGIKGTLATMRRSGFVQITLSGRPLYRFSIDTAKGQANGEGIHSFGGVWHVVKEGGSARGTTTTSTTSTSPASMTTTSTSSTYTYPAY